MSPRTRSVIGGVSAGLLALVGGVGIANENYLIAAACSAVIFWALAEKFGGAYPDAWLLAGALFGYIAGNRGFAQLQLAPGLPLFPAEAALLAAGLALLVRLARKRAHAFHHDALNYAIIAWLVLGTARLPLDSPRHGFFAVRDYAMVYYAAFFFLGQAYAGHTESARLLSRVITAACLALPPLATAFRFFPQFFIETLTVRGNPVIFYKDDLLATLFAAAFFWLWTRWEVTRGRLWLVPIAASLLMIATTASPRAAMVAVAGVTGLWLLARRWRVAAAQGAIIGAAALGAVALVVVGNRDIRESAAYPAYENVVSIFDYRATGSYGARQSGDPGDNNRFRIVWWRAVAEETVEENPVFGLGFGHDLAARFLADYGLLQADDFSARSPHSMIMSVFGRLGFAGLVGWLAIAGAMVALMSRALRTGSADRRGFASVAWVIWISACFGVVLEGPMGAVVFWTALGLANAAPDDTDPAQNEAEFGAKPSVLLPPAAEPATFRPRPVSAPFPLTTPPPRP